MGSDNCTIPLPPWETILSWHRSQDVVPGEYESNHTIPCNSIQYNPMIDETTKENVVCEKQHLLPG